MDVPIKIKHQYTPVNGEAVKLLEIVVNQSMELNFGDSIVINPKNPTILTIHKAQLMPSPY